MEEKPTSTSSIDDIIDLYKRDIDRTLIRKNLDLTVEQRFDRIMALQRFADELKQAGKAARQRV